MRNKIIYLLIVFTFRCTLLVGQNFEELQTLFPTDATDNEESGMSVTISGDYAAIGAWKEDLDEMGADSLVNAGAVYIFERNASGTWVEVQKIVASDRSVRDRFGKTVAMDGNYLVVGAPLKDIVSANPDAGAAYVFERNSMGVWEEVKVLLSSDRTELDEFGTSVSIFGKTIVIGAPLEDQNTMNMDTKDGAGSAYIFKRDALGDWTETQKIVGLDRDIGDFFGIDVSVWDSTIIVGAYQDDLAVTQENAGSVYFFQQNTNGDFIETQKVTASDIDADDFFGYAVDIFDDKVVIGAYQEDEDLMSNNTFSDAGSAYVFEKGTDGFWHQEQKIVASDRDAGDFFGYDVAISGNVILIGARLEDQDDMGNNFRNSSGSGYFFEKNENGNWEQFQKVVASDRSDIDNYGTAVSISVDYAFIGSPFNDKPQTDNNTGTGYLLHGACLSDLIIALDAVPSRTFKADNSIVTLDEVNIFSSETTIFKAGTSITLTPGFWAHSGTDFWAYIDPCVPSQLAAPITSTNVQEEKRKTISDNSLKVFPNPNHGSMSIQFDIAEEKPTRIDLFHSSGKLIKSIFSGKDIGSYNLEIEESLSAGVYYFRMSTDSQQYIHKVVVLQN